MPIRQIGIYIQWCMEGDGSLESRRQLLIEHRQAVIQQINELQHNLEAINHKIEHYNTLCSRPMGETQEYSAVGEVK